MLSEENFLTEPHENELLTVREQIFQVVIASLVQSPTTQHALQRLGYLKSPENQEDVRMASAVLEDAETALQATKRKRSNDDRAATHVSLSFLSGEKVNSGKLKVRSHKD